MIPEIEVDAEVTFQELTDQFTKIISFFEPFGPGNMTPVFITRDVQIVGEVRLAKANTHILRVRESETKKIFEAVFFNSLEYKDIIVTGNFCDICYSIDRSFWNGKEYTKLRLRDIKLSSC